MHAGGPRFLISFVREVSSDRGSARNRCPCQNVLITIKNRISLGQRKHAFSQPKPSTDHT